MIARLLPAPAFAPSRLRRLALGACGLAAGFGLALALPAEAFGAVARFFDSHVVEAFHGLALERFLCL